MLIDKQGITLFALLKQYLIRSVVDWKHTANRCSQIAKNILSRRFYAANIIQKTMDQHQVVPDVVYVAPVEVAKVTYPDPMALPSIKETNRNLVKSKIFQMNNAMPIHRHFIWCA